MFLISNIHPPFSFFFFLIIPPPPRSTLFPYTTLFRSVGPRHPIGCPHHPQVLSTGRGQPAPPLTLPAVPVDGEEGERGSTLPFVLVCWLVAALRSEEHTSELQSHVNLVCRLLLEKKKQ